VAGARVGIVGGGVLGLALAYRLSAAGARVTVFETGAQPGGLATWRDYGLFVWDRFYHVITPRDGDLLALIDELGLGGEVVWRPTRVGFLWRNRLLSMSNHREFLTFPALSPLAKVRLGLGILRTIRIRDASRYEGITAAEWLPRVFGEGVTRTMWTPLLESKFGVLADRVPASFMVVTIQRAFGARAGGGGSERLGYLHGGYRTFLSRIVERITSQGGEVRLGTPVEAIEADPAGAAIRTAAGRDVFDRVVSTIPNPLFRRLAAGVPDLEGGTTGEPAFLGVVCLVLVLRRALSPYYVTNLIQRDLPFTGIIEYTALADAAEETAGHHLVYLPRYDVPDSPWFERSDEDLTEEGLRSLERIWPEVRSWVVRSFVHRERRVQALWLPGTRQRTAPLRSRSAPIESITAELVGLDTLNNNAVIRLVNEQAVRLGRGSRPQVG
jgi:protoporphyrinogen oxidase